MDEINYFKPLKLRENRVWRTYQGGKLLDEFQGKVPAVDTHFPEEWILSIVTARNSGREHIVDEGLGLLDQSIGNIKTLKDLIVSYPTEALGEQHVRKSGEHTGVLVKLIDASERLAVQVHPNRQMARKLFNSEYGKTECWHILAGRTIDGEPPFVYLGFKPSITRKKWEQLFKLQDIAGMLECLHKVYVKPGQTYLLEGGIPHAIGSGCFLVEIQEPTDLTIRTERISPSGFQIEDNMCHQGIGFEKMFDCFRYEGYTKEETLERWKINSIVLHKCNGHIEKELIGYQTTPYFRLTMLEVFEEVTIKRNELFTGLYVLEGEALIEMDGQTSRMSKADQYFLPAHRDDVKITKQDKGTFKVLRIYGPEVE